MARRPGGRCARRRRSFAALREQDRAVPPDVLRQHAALLAAGLRDRHAAIIRHIGVVFRIANGDIYGWEGSNGCCQPTCTHVWGYEQTLSRLFPDLERDMRRIDFKHQQRADGGVNNRTDVPSPPRPTGEQPVRRRPRKLHSQGLPRGAEPARTRRFSRNTGRTSSGRSNT